MPRLTKLEVTGALSIALNKNVSEASGNWLKIDSPSSTELIYFSQCKPSSSSKGNWNYEFFHTIRLEILQEVGVKSGHLVLVNYVNHTYCLLDAADLIWVVRYSSRRKINDGEVCDFVIDRDRHGQFQLRPYDRIRPERRVVEVVKW